MIRLSVPDMSCGHCKASVEGALAALPGAAPFTIDLQKREVEASGNPAALLAALAEIGFPAQVITAN